MRRFNPRNAEQNIETGPIMQQVVLRFPADHRVSFPAVVVMPWARGIAYKHLHAGSRLWLPRLELTDDQAS